MSKAGAKPDDGGRARTNSKRRPSGCPICGAPRHTDFRPFCSKRCADVDLGRWLSEAYVVPGSASEEADDTPSDQQLARGEK